MGRGQNQYTDEFKNTLVELYNSGKSNYHRCPDCGHQETVEISLPLN